MKIWLIRHSQSFLNEQKKFVGRENSNLSPTGKKNAKRIGTFLKKKVKKPGFICSSTLSRAKQTASIIGVQLQCKTVLQEKALAEQDFGLWEKKTREEVEKKQPGIVSKWLSSPYKVTPPKGENYYSLEKRLKPFAKKMKKMKGKNLVIVTHANVIKVLIKLLLKLKEKEALKIDTRYSEFTSSIWKKRNSRQSK